MAMRDNKEFRRALQKTVGERLVKARELSGMKQDAAARKIGYVNGSKLSKIEQASDTYSIPFEAVVKLSRLYMVSLDYLVGNVDDWDETLATTSERNTAQWLQDSFEKARSRDVWLIKKALRHNQLTLESIDMMMDAFEKVVSAFDKFTSVNECFDDMRGGNRLMMSIEKMRDVSALVDGNLKRMNFNAKKDNMNQGDLFDGFSEEEAC